jgi:hypothetical protein
MANDCSTGLCFTTKVSVDEAIRCVRNRRLGQRTPDPGNETSRLSPLSDPFLHRLRQCDLFFCFYIWTSISKKVTKNDPKAF